MSKENDNTSSGNYKHENYLTFDEVLFFYIFI